MLRAFSRHAVIEEVLTIWKVTHVSIYTSCVDDLSYYLGTHMIYEAELTKRDHAIILKQLPFKVA